VTASAFLCFLLFKEPLMYACFCACRL
jgi:hypothetical protein